MAIDSAVGWGNVLNYIMGLAFFIPTVTVSVRRLHDLDKSGFWIFLSLIPIIGSLILLVWQCSRGTTGPNRFGADPLAQAVESR